MEFFRNVHPYTAQIMAVIEAIDEQLKETDKGKKNCSQHFLAELLKITPGIVNFSALMIIGEIADIKI